MAYNFYKPIQSSVQKNLSTNARESHTANWDNLKNFKINIFWNKEKTQIQEKINKQLEKV